MDLNGYYSSLSAEMMAVKDRVRQLIGPAHWPSDGEHKETILRQAIRRIAPRNMVVGKGFIVSPEYTSTQIDVLVYDDRYPVHYQDGDLFMIPPAACRAVIEVKSALHNIGQFQATAAKQIAIQRGLRDAGVTREVFSGLLYYENNIQNSGERIGRCLAELAAGDPQLAINHVALGTDRLFKFWDVHPQHREGGRYNHWHEYNMPQRAFGYFLYNLVVDPTIVPPDAVYFPPEGKEINLDAVHRLDLP
jgi:hypothetical protein